MNKLIVLDGGMYTHRAIFAWRNQKNIPVEYTYLRMVISHLQKIGVDPTDEMILACEGKNNWRKQFSQEYKANRKSLRDSFEDVNWDEMYSKLNALTYKIADGLGIHRIEVDNCEADDIAAMCPKVFKDKEIILVSVDADWEMLWEYDQIKIFSPLKKYKGVKGMYKIKPEKFNVYKLISKKINKEVSDNLISPILSEEDFDRRKMLVSLIDLPEFIEDKIIKVLQQLEPKLGDINKLPFDSIKDIVANLYNETDKIITYEDCVKYVEKKKKRKKKKKEKKKC